MRERGEHENDTTPTREGENRRPDEGNELERATAEGDIAGGAGLSTRVPEEIVEGFESSGGRIIGGEGRSTTGAIGNVGSDATTQGPLDDVPVEDVPDESGPAKGDYFTGEAAGDQMDE